VTVVTGFLGAGKTTLLNRWLAEHARGDLAVIVNEHGEVGIDGELLAARARTLVEIAGGCICCSTQSELVRALESLAGEKRILIETSGAASPSGVLHAIAGAERRGTHVLDGIVTVVDASRLDALREHDLAIEQIGYADAIVLSHTDVASNVTREHLADLNGAAVVHTPMPLEELLAARSDDFVVRREAPPAKPHVYESIALVSDRDVDGERFADFVETSLAACGGRIFRTKGILAVRGVSERMIVHGVTDRAEISFGAPWADASRTSRLVIVGYGLDRDALTTAFRATLA
jgi:G3E family GTPase